MTDLRLILYNIAKKSLDGGPGSGRRPEGGSKGYQPTGKPVGRPKLNSSIGAYKSKNPEVDDIIKDLAPKPNSNTSFNFSAFEKNGIDKHLISALEDNFLDYGDEEYAKEQVTDLIKTYVSACPPGSRKNGGSFGDEGRDYVSLMLDKFKSIGIRINVPTKFDSSNQLASYVGSDFKEHNTKRKEKPYYFSKNIGGYYGNPGVMDPHSPTFQGNATPEQRSVYTKGSY